MKFSDYKRLCYKWQHAVLNALRTALASNEYVQTRNALLFLSYNTKVGLSSAAWLPHSCKHLPSGLCVAFSMASPANRDFESFAHI